MRQLRLSRQFFAISKSRKRLPSLRPLLTYLSYFLHPPLPATEFALTKWLAEVEQSDLPKYLVVSGYCWSGLMTYCCSPVKNLVGTLLLAALSLNGLGCSKNSEKKSHNSASSECGFDGTRLPQGQDLGFTNLIDCMSIERRDRSDNYHFGLSLWASKSRVMPKMFFPLNSPTAFVLGQTYLVDSTTTVSSANEPQEYVEFPTGQVYFTELGSSDGEITKGTLQIDAKSVDDGKTRNATFEFAVPTEVSLQ